MVEIYGLFYGYTNSKKKLFKRMIIKKNPRSINSGISTKRHRVATEDISIINKALKIYL